MARQDLSTRLVSFRETTGVFMSSEQPKLNNSEADNNSTTTMAKTEPAPPNTTGAAAATGSATQPATEEPDESRASGDVDFGQLLDQFEQEQATLQEGEVVARHGRRFKRARSRNRLRL
jgi:septal ring-binding cell division protein DamX